MGRYMEFAAGISPAHALNHQSVVHQTHVEPRGSAFHAVCDRCGVVSETGAGHATPVDAATRAREHVEINAKPHSDYRDTLDDEYQ